MRENGGKEKELPARGRLGAKEQTWEISSVCSRSKNIQDIE